VGAGYAAVNVSRVEPGLNSRQYAADPLQAFIKPLAGRENQRAVDQKGEKGVPVPFAVKIAAAGKDRSQTRDNRAFTGKFLVLVEPCDSRLDPVTRMIVLADVVEKNARVFKIPGFEIKQGEVVERPIPYVCIFREAGKVMKAVYLSVRSVGFSRLENRSRAAA